MTTFYINRKTAQLLLLLLSTAPALAQTDTLIHTKPLTQLYSGSDQLHYARYSELYDEEIAEPRCGTFYQQPDPDTPVPDGQHERYIWSEGPCKNGKLDGTWRQYFNHRPWVWIECAYTNGKRNGRYTRYDQRGKVMETRMYKNGKLDGDVIIYGTNGMVESREHYKDSLFDGCQHYGSEDICYRNGKRSGKNTAWSDATRKEKRYELVYENDTAVSGTYYDYPELRFERIAPERWRCTVKTDKGIITGFLATEGPSRKYRHEAYEVADVLRASDGRGWYAYDSLWISPHDKGDSVRCMYRDGMPAWCERYHRNDSGSVCLRQDFYLSPWKERSDNRAAAMHAGSVRSTVYSVNGTVLRRREYFLKTSPATGVLREQVDYENNRTVSVLRLYTDGSDSARWSFDKNAGVWSCRWTSADSSLYGSRHYTADSVRSGEWITTDRKLHSVTSEQYRNGKPGGQHTVTVNNVPVEKGAYSNGLKTGAWLERAANGEVSEGNYVDGKRTGRWNEWYLYGLKKKASGMYADGEKSGKWQQWDADGKKLKSIHYTSTR